MKRIYVAGPYSADNVIRMLDNIREGIKASKDVLLAGYAPFCPWLDHMYHLMLEDDDRLHVSHYQECSMAWLKASDGVLVLPGWEDSKGTCSEIRMAELSNIPIFYDLETLKERMPA